MSELTKIEREAKQVRDFIAELKGLTPKFNAAKERAEEELKLHLNKIDCERARLKELQDAASLIVQRLGIEDAAEVEPVDWRKEQERFVASLTAGGTQADPTSTDSDVYADVEAVVAMADSPQDEAEAEANTFESLHEIAAEITAGVAAIADAAPETPDATDEPELTDEQVERKEVELAEAAPRSPKMFNAFAANPFA